MKNLNPLILYLTTSFSIIIGFYLFVDLFYDIFDLYFTLIWFGVVVGGLNYFLQKNKKPLHILYSVVISLTTFAIIFAVLLLLSKINMALSLSNSVTYNWAVTIISPLIVLFSYSWFYKIDIGYRSVLIILIATFLIFITNYLIGMYFNNVPRPKMLNVFLIWQLITALSIQFLLIQKYNLDLK